MRSARTCALNIVIWIFDASEMVRNLTMRHKVNKATRDYFDAQGFHRD